LLACYSQRKESTRRFRQRADMQELVGVERHDRGLADGDHGDGVSDGIKYFEAVTRLLAPLSGVVLDHRCDVPAAESVLRQIGIQRDSGEQFVFRLYCNSKRQDSSFTAMFVAPLLWPHRVVSMPQPLRERLQDAAGRFCDEPNGDQSRQA
jgi:hypothetical protein